MPKCSSKPTKKKVPKLAIRCDDFNDGPTPQKKIDESKQPIVGDKETSSEFITQ